MEEDEERDRIRKKMMRDPEYRRQQMIAERANIPAIKQSVDEERGKEPLINRKILNLPVQQNLSDDETNLQIEINYLLDRAVEAGVGDLQIIKEINDVVMRSKGIEDRTGSVHRQALERIEERFYTRLLPLAKELKRLNGI